MCGVTGSERPPLHEILELGRTRAKLPVEEFWTGYMALGGNESIDRIRAFLVGTSVPSRIEYDVMVHCVNERLRELGARDPLPYGEEIDL